MGEPLRLLESVDKEGKVPWGVLILVEMTCGFPPTRCNQTEEQNLRQA